MRIRTKMPDLTGNEMILNNENSLQKENKVTLVYFWSMSCKQCEDSFPNLLELLQRFSDKVTVITIHMPRIAEDHNVQAIEQQLKRLGISFPVYIDEKQRLTNLFNNRFVPAYYLFDEQKELRFFQAGYITKKNLQRRIERLIQ